MTPTPVKLPPNPIRHFYRGGPAIAEPIHSSARASAG